MLMLPLLGACQPRHCVETYSPVVKLLVGAPIPVMITTAIAAAMISSIDAALGRPKRRRPGAWLMVALTCLLPFPMARLLGPTAMGVTLLLSLALVVLATLLRGGDDSNHRSWTHAISGALEPSIGSRMFGGFLVVMLLVVTFIGTAVTALCVSEAGLRCDEGVAGPQAPR